MPPVSSHPRQPGRPKTSLLTSKKITATAQKLIEKTGSFTMSTLARELKVAPSSLYNHVSCRDEVLAAISDRVVEGISTQQLRAAAEQVRAGQLAGEAARQAWIEATTTWACSYRQAFSLTPVIVTTLAITPVQQAPATLTMYEQVVASFTAFGLSPSQALLTVEALEAFLLGSAIDAQAPNDIFSPGPLGNEHPTMRDAFGHLGPTPQEEAFTIGLTALLKGLAASLPL